MATCGSLDRTLQSVSVKLTRIYEINLLALLLCLFCWDRESVGELLDVLLGYIYIQRVLYCMLVVYTCMVIVVGTYVCA